MPDKIYIYGDSLLKATVPDVDFHYHFHINEVMQLPDQAGGGGEPLENGSHYPQGAEPGAA